MTDLLEIPLPENADTGISIVSIPPPEGGYSLRWRPVPAEWQETRAPHPGAYEHVSEIVLTGGSCAGKTSALADLSTMLREYGVRVLVVPEVATMLVKGKAIEPGVDGDGGLLTHWRSEVVSAASFYSRRVKRILPTYVLTLLWVLLAGGLAFGRLRSRAEQLEDDTIWAAGFATNIRQMQTLKGYGETVQGGPKKVAVGSKHHAF